MAVPGDTRGILGDQSGDKEDFLATARKRYQYAMECTQENRENQQDDIKFAAGSPDNGWQWPADVMNKRQNDPNGARPVLTINKLPQHIRLVTNEQRQNRRSIKVLPVDDKGDPEVATVLNGICRHVEIRSHADMVYDLGGENQVKMGEGYWRVLTEYIDEMSFDQDMRIAPVRNSFSVVLDPDGLRKDSTGRQCEWGFITDKLTKEEYERTFPNAKSRADFEISARGEELSQWFDQESVRIAEYFHVEYDEKTICLWPDGTVNVKGDMPQNAAYAAPLKERITQIRKVKWSKINGFEELDSRDWPGKYIPIVRCAGNEDEVDGKLVVSGAVRNSKDACRMYNYWVSQEAEFLALAPKAPFVGAVGQFETMNEQWATANNINYSRLEYDPIDVNGQLLPPPQRQAPPIPPAGIISAKMGAADDIQATLGQYNPSLGAEAKEKSGKAIVARQRQADVGTFHYLDNQSRAIQFTGEILVDLAPKVLDTKRIARIIGEDGEPSQCSLDPEQSCAVLSVPGENGAIQKIYNINVGRYDVVISVGPSYTTKRIEAAEGMAMILQSNPQLWQVCGDLFVKNMDWPGAEDFAKRLRKTIPPQLLDDPNAAASPEAQQQQIQQAAHALGQREAQLNAAQDQVMQAAQSATEQEQKAKEAIARAESKVAELNVQNAELVAEHESLAAAKRELALSQRLNASELDKKLSEAIFMVERMLAKHEEAVKGELEAAEPNEEQSAIKPETVDAILASTAATAEAVRNMLSTLAAPRVTELMLDGEGNPIGSRSRVDMQTVQ